MERFTFHPITLADIATALGLSSVDLRLTTNEDGSMEIETPNLPTAKKVKLRLLFTNRGFVEGPR